MKRNKIVNAVMVAVVGTSIAVAATPPASAASHNKKNAEKCYGIVKAKMNDCGTPQHACAGQAKTNSDPHEWIYVLKGNCKRIVGGNSKPPTS